MNHMDGAVRNLQKTCADQTQKYQSHFRREYQTVGRAFLQLGEALRQDGSSPSAGLTRAIVATGEGYEEIGRMFDEQTKLDWERLGDVMHDYRGILSEWPGVLQIHSVSVCEKSNVKCTPTNIGTTRSTPMAMPLVVINDGSQNLGCFRLL